MKNKLFSRGLLGFPLGIAIGYLITLFISISIGDGSFHPVAPELTESMGSELNAVILQTALFGIMGSGYAMASVIWEMDSWSLAKQSGIYFAVACAVTLPIAYISNWMEHSFVGVISYIGVFVAIFIAIWLILYCVLRSKIKKMNSRVKSNNEAE